MSHVGQAFRRYGVIDFGTADVAAVPCWSLDLRQQTGGQQPDESGVVPAGIFKRALFGSTPGEHPTGEIRMIVNGREIALVGELTGRAGVVEMTPQMLWAADQDNTYRAQWRAYLGMEAT